MRFSCSKDQLVHAVQVVQKAVSNKPQMPILSGIYINAQPDCIEIQATDYEIGVINSISKKEGALRQQSKAPTFRPYLSGHLPDPDDQLWFL